MRDTFLILRSRASDTLIQASRIREEADRLGYDDPVRDVRCPTVRVLRRVGRKRHREEQDTPILGSFIFVRWAKEDTYFVNYLEDRFPFIGAMRMPQGGFASCQEREIDTINKLELPVVDETEPVVQWQRGETVQVLPAIAFLRGVVGSVVKVKNNGEVVLKILDNKGLSLSTLLIHGSQLQVSTWTPPVAA